jgi:hypothetical protein
MFQVTDNHELSLRWGGLGEGADYISQPIFTADSASMIMADSQGDTAMLRIFSNEFGDIIGGASIAFAGELSLDPSGTQLAIVARDGSRVDFYGLPE